MLKFYLGDRVFDIRYGWGVVTQSHNRYSVMVKFTNQEEVILYGNDSAKGILSFTEYEMEGFTSERPKLTWDSIWREWMRDKNDTTFGSYLDQNFEQPIRKCK